ncbi:hypothetical protein M513_04576, partial [Trichuris suis]
GPLRNGISRKSRYATPKIRYIHFVRTGIIIFHQPYIFCKLLHQIIRKHYIGQTLLWQQMQTNASQKRAQYRNMEQDDKFNKLPTQRL